MVLGTMTPKELPMRRMGSFMGCIITSYNITVMPIALVNPTGIWSRGVQGQPPFLGDLRGGISRLWSSEIQ